VNVGVTDTGAARYTSLTMAVVDSNTHRRFDALKCARLDRKTLKAAGESWAKYGVRELFHPHKFSFLSTNRHEIPVRHRWRHAKIFGWAKLGNLRPTTDVLQAIYGLQATLSRALVRLANTLL